MKINRRVEVKKLKDKDLVLLELSNDGEKGTIFGSSNPIVDKLDDIYVRLTVETARKLGEALLKLSKGK